MRELREDAIELTMLRVLIPVVRSPSAVVFRGECLDQIVKSCYNVYLGRSQNGTNQLCATLVLAQIPTTIYAGVEDDTIEVRVRTLLVAVEVHVRTVLVAD